MHGTGIRSFGAYLPRLRLERAAIVEAMHENPKLIERPIVFVDGRAAIGRPPESVLALLE